MHTLRTRIAQDIVCEFLPPRRESQQVIIFCDGMPGLPGNKKVMEFFSQKGFWTFYPRYRGTWESGGEFLDHDPTQDILDVVDALHAGPIVSVWDTVSYTIAHPEIYLVGISFGGPAAILGSRDPRVVKSISLSGVVDWREADGVEPMEWLRDVTRQAFGHAYRFSHEDWLRLERGEIYNPIDHVSEYDARKILLIHAEDDEIVPIQPVKQFADRLGCQRIFLKKGEHLPTRQLTRWPLWRKVKKFLNDSSHVRA